MVGGRNEKRKVEPQERPQGKRQCEPSVTPKCASGGVGSFLTALGPSPRLGWFLPAFHSLCYSNCKFSLYLNFAFMTQIRFLRPPKY